MHKQIATVFGLGYLRPASGTWASAVAVAVGVGLHWLGHFPLLAAATVLVTILGFWSVRHAVVGHADKDPREFVIDEVAGQWLALCFPSAGFWLMGLPSDVFPYPGWLAAFIFFRLFDIWKPWLVGRADRRGDADGIMIDDLWAGLFAGIATMLAAGAAHGFLMG
ncbi:phosphatidylglycerophosphatase A family protein [Paracoccus aminophilus]|uniref:Phosphatidylglycerophosphatase A n=1 Tax=Paracoccus aminophilus JCM 7686 TaxID=1367847 RepID=S5YTD1_PARAH|nr:phosphatidylglycerophosphatase A [Paracoccus aminophilus]AGT08486.1 phosphatidylglycerophosphatase A [Paracoccus aminophilus JCM 7686]